MERIGSICNNKSDLNTNIPIKLSSARIIITGSNGFIGSHLVEYLSQFDPKITAIVHSDAVPFGKNSSFISKNILNKIQVIKGDVADPNFIADAINGVDFVFHLAALVSVSQSFLKPSLFKLTNVEGTRNILEAARKGKIGRLIYTSSSEVYSPGNSAANESAYKIYASSPYADTKISAERLIQYYVKNFNIDATILRPFNTYGPRQSARAIIPNIITQALWGNRIVLNDPHATRDFSFVDDIVRGLVAAAVAQPTKGEPINLGSGTTIALGEIATRVMRHQGRDLPILMTKAAEGSMLNDRPRPWACTKLARSLLDWSTQTSLDDGLAQTIAFVENQRDMYDNAYCANE